jgi:hypothetical protein
MTPCGSSLALGAAGVLAIAAATAGAAGSRSPAAGSASEPIVMYHGAHRWRGPPQIVPLRKGHAEHGPGIYLTTSWPTASRYARGGGSVLRMEVSPSIRLAHLVHVDAAEFLRRASSIPRLPGRAALTAALERLSSRMGPRVRGDHLLAAIVNSGSAAGRSGPAMAGLLVEVGVDADLFRSPIGKGEEWLVVFDPNAILSVRRVTPDEVRRRGFAFDLPLPSSLPSLSSTLEIDSPGQSM